MLGTIAIIKDCLSTSQMCLQASITACWSTVQVINYRRVGYEAYPLQDNHID